jgi:hypothetical protein
VTIFGQNWCELITNIAEAEAHPVAPPFPDPCYGDVRLDDRVVHAEILSVDGRVLFGGACRDHVLRLESPGTVVIRGYDMEGVLIGTWRVIVLER